MNRLCLAIRGIAKRLVSRFPGRSTHYRGQKRKLLSRVESLCAGVQGDGYLRSLLHSICFALAFAAANSGRLSKRALVI
jgi:hypothetical protein